MKLYASFLFLWLLLIAALAGYAALYQSVANASVRAFGEYELPAPTRTTTNYDARLKRYTVSPDALPSFTEDLVARAETVGVAASVTSVPASDERFFRFAILLKGDFEAVMRSIGVIEYAPYVLSVDELRAGVGESGEWLSELTFSVGSQTVL